MVWVFCSLLLAALISPWVYQVGRHLADAAAAKQLPGFLVWLGEACGRSGFDRFFSRSLMFSALVFMPFLFRRIKRLRSNAGGGSTDARVRVPWRAALIQIAVGCLISGSLLVGMGFILTSSGAYAARPHVHLAGQILTKILLPAAGAAFVEEWLFRGVLLGLWLRFARPLAACIGTSLLFAFLHFLEPPAGMAIADPGAAGAGFKLLGMILLHFTDPLFFVTNFATLFVVGMILAWARVRTGALWFSIGLHAGWVMTFKGFNILTQTVRDSPLHPWGVGDSLLSGVLPLAALALTGLVSHHVLRFLPAGKPTV